MGFVQNRNQEDFDDVPGEVDDDVPSMVDDVQGDVVVSPMIQAALF